MAVLTCPQGHQWEVPSREGATLAAEAVVCPRCGASGDNRTSAGPLTDSPPPARVERTLVDASPSAVNLPRIPGYELLGLLGRGGMGLVYRARQVGLNRLVALKVVRGGALATPQLRVRFRIEAEAIARLQHPHVVQIHEVGEHDGCPYFAMELVEGGTLAEHLDAAPVAADEAARLVEVLARAIHSAHLRGIVHRDLKPSNVLLQAHELQPVGLGLPKITDFGLAKLLEDDEALAPTRAGAILGTPTYMAPEQAWGRPQDVGPATDIYGLGVILYEMLGGRPPFRGKTDLETLDLVRSAEPPPPSQFRAKVPRDLETICLKCLRKEPARRYATADDLADDLRRFLQGEPIRARPVGRGERLLMWARRRPAAAALVLCLVLVTAAALAGGVLHEVRLRDERDRAEKNLRVALAAVDQMLTEVADKDLHAEPRSELKRRRLLEKALAFYQDLLRDRDTDPALRRETAQAHLRLADVRRLLEDGTGAEEAYGQAITRFERLRADFPEEPDYRWQLAYGHNFRGEVFRAAGRRDEARADYAVARALQEQLSADFPGRPEYPRDLARTHYNQGLLLADGGEPVAAEQEFDAAVALLSPLARGHDPEARQHLARAHLDRATVLRRRGQAANARADCDAAIALFQGLADADPPNPDYRCELAIAFADRANTFDAGERPAENGYGTALRILRELTADFPRVPGYRVELANTCNSLAAAFARADQPAEALKRWDEARDLWRGLVAQAPGRGSYRGDLGMTLGNLGWLHLKQHEPRDALACLEEAVGELRAALTANAAQPDYRQAQRRAVRDLAAALLRLGRHEEAAQRAAELASEEPRDLGCYLAACFLARCVAEAQGAAAERYAEQARTLLRQAVADGRSGLRALADDPGFEPLRQRDDFRRLLDGAPEGR
jgi:tetratricopeptide (TPR) repeat protein